MSSVISTLGTFDALEDVFSRPEVLGHNLETVPRIFKRIRPAFRAASTSSLRRRGGRTGHRPTSSWAWARPVTRSRRLRPLLVECALRHPHHHPVLQSSVAPHLPPLGRTPGVRDLSRLAEEIGFAAVMSGPACSPTAPACCGDGPWSSASPRSPKSLAARRAGHRSPGGVAAGSPLHLRRRLPVTARPTQPAGFPVHAGRPR